MTPKAPNNPSRITTQCDDTPPSIVIIMAIAALENIDPIESPTELGITLYDYIDPEALNHLITNTRDTADVTVDLTIHNEEQYSVQIEDSGEITVQKTL